jgi:hypothetical protein
MASFPLSVIAEGDANHNHAEYSTVIGNQTPSARGGGLANLTIVPHTQSVPLGLRTAVTRCLRFFPAGDLAGLGHVELWRTPGDISDISIVGKKVCELDPLWLKAIYHRKSEFSQAFIVLFIDSIYIPLEVFNRLPPILTLYLCHFMAHEVGHHLIAERGYVFTPEEKYPNNEIVEEMANRYAHSIIMRMKAKWYYRVADWTLKYFSKVYFEEGRQNWKKGAFQAAASSWYKSWLLNTENEDAGKLYWHARSRTDETE